MSREQPGRQEARWGSQAVVWTPYPLLISCDSPRLSTDQEAIHMIHKHLHPPPKYGREKKLLMAGVSTLTTLVQLRVAVPPDTHDVSLLLWLYPVSMHGSPSSLSMDRSSFSPGAPPIEGLLWGAELATIPSCALCVLLSSSHLLGSNTLRH